MATVGIVGCGLCGLLIARGLQERGEDVFLLDKSRGVGGRIATRRFEGGHYDTGTPIIPKRDTWMEPFVGAGILQPEGLGFRSVPVMTTLPKAMAEGLDLYLGERLEALVRETSSWKLKTANGEFGPVKELILTLPVPQMLDLLRASSIELDVQQRKALEQVEYRKQLMLLAKVEEAFDFKRDGLITEVVDQGERGSPAEEGHYLLSFSTKFSDEHYDLKDEEVIEMMEVALKERGIRPLRVNLKRWKFSRVTKAYKGEGPGLIGHPGLWMAGDAFGGGDVAGAVSSAKSILNSLARDH